MTLTLDHPVPHATAALPLPAPPGPWVRRSRPSPQRVALVTLQLLATAWLSLSGGLLFWSTVPAAAGWTPRLILSGSMQPGLHPGDVVLTTPVTNPRTLIPGQVLAVTDPALPAGNYLHRLIRRQPDGHLITRGDANRTNDYPPATPDRIQGLARVVIPTVGTPLLQARHGNPIPLTLAALATLTSIALLARRTATATHPQFTAVPALPAGLTPIPLRTATHHDTLTRPRPTPDPRRTLAHLAGPAFLLMSITALLTWTPTTTTLTAQPTDQLATLNRYLPTAATATTTPPSGNTSIQTCRLAWTPAPHTPPQVAYDITDQSGRTLAADIHGTTTSIALPDPDQTLSIRTRIDGWTSANAATISLTCRNPGHRTLTR